MAGRSTKRKREREARAMEPHAYPPMPVCPVRPMPFDQLYPQFPLPEAFQRGTLFPWLYDPYQRERADC